MAGYRLTTYVHAVELDATGARAGRDQVFGPDDDLSAPVNQWALAAITNDAVWADGKAPERPPAPAPEPDRGDEVARLLARIAELEAAQVSGPAGDGLKPPPRQGPGSGADRWRAYAASVDVEVPADASREDVIAALDEAGKPTK